MAKSALETSIRSVPFFPIPLPYPEDRYNRKWYPDNPLIAGGIVDVSGPAIGKDQVGNDGKWLVFFVNLFLYGRNLFGHTQVIEFNPLSEGAVEFLTHTVFNMDVFQNVLKSCGASCQCQASGFVLFF